MGRISGPVVNRLNLPSIAHLRDIVKLNRTAVTDLNRHSLLVAVSQATQEFHVTSGLCPGKVQTIPNGVDLQEFQPRSPSGYLHRELGIPVRCPLVAAIGQISLRKGPDLFLQSARIVAAENPDVHFLMVGSRTSQKVESCQLERDLHSLASTLPLSGRVHFVGQRLDVASIMPELTLLIHPSRQEPLGRVLLEAGASGVAIVATSVGGTSEIFPEEAQAAYRIPPEQIGQMAAAMIQLLRDPQERRRLGQAARRRIAAAFDVIQSGRALVRVYDKLSAGA